MGDRANIKVRYDGGQEIYFYGHWAGREYVERARKAIAKRWRWDDPAYLARIVFCEFVKGYEWKETGFGIAPWICDNEHLILEIDTSKRLVTLEGYAPQTFEEFASGKEFAP